MASLVFFGAGASRPFGIPTMQEMVMEFENKIKDENPDCYEFYSNIKDTLLEKYGAKKIDIESISSVLNGIVSEIKAKDLGFYAYYHIQEFCKSKNVSYPEGRPSDEYVDKAKKTENLLRDYIKTSCKVNLSNSELNDVYQKSCVPFFSNIQGRSTEYPDHSLVSDWKAYTTNYDSIFENFWNAFSVLRNHFQKEGNSNNYVFVDGQLDNHSLSKLHGSLDWTKETQTGRILKKNESGYSIYNTQGEVMLSPVQQKDLYLHPWFILFSDLRRGLQSNEIWYVVGYAFNDEFILNTFQEFLSNDSNKILVIINPDAKRIISKFPESVRKQIHLLPIKFGNKFFETQFADYRKSVKTLVLRIVPNNEKFSIKCHNHKIKNSREITESEKSVNITQDEDGHSRFFSVIDPKDKEIKIELEIEYDYGDTIELSIRDDTKELDFGIDYCDIMIASSHDIDEYVEHTQTWIEMKNPIIINETNLYRVQCQQN